MAKITNSAGPRKGTRRVTITFAPGVHVPDAGGDFNTSGNWRIRKVYHGSARDADEWAGALVRQLEKQWSDLQLGIVPIGKVPTLAEFADEYRLHLANNYRNERTRLSYTMALENQVLPHLGKLKLTEIKRAQVERFKADITVGESRTNTALVVLRGILKLAMEDGYIDTLPPTRAKVVKPTRVEESEYWTEDETARVVAALPSEQAIATWVLFALGSGLRRGELAGLRWADVDLEAGHVWVRQQITTTGKVATPKHGSVRKVPLNATSTGALLRQRAATYMRDGLVFDFSKRTETAFYRLQRKAGVKRITIHGMRHTFATRALREGTGPRTLQKWLGHRNITMTMRYAHVTEELHTVDAAKFPDLTDTKLTTTPPGAVMDRTPQP